MLGAYFGRLDAAILDFYHASEHLGDFAKAWWGDAAAAEACMRRGPTGSNTRVGRRSWDGSRARISRPIRGVAGLEEIVGYFRNHHHRMDYPSYRARGWQIGSGPVESACKTVIGQRMKGSGMRWGHEGADAVCHLRALLLSEKGQSEAFWANRRRKAA